MSKKIAEKETVLKRITNGICSLVQVLQMIINIIFVDNNRDQSLFLFICI